MNAIILDVEMEHDHFCSLGRLDIIMLVLLLLAKCHSKFTVNKLN